MKKLKKKFLEWLLKDIDELKLPRKVIFGDKTLIIDTNFIDWDLMTTDPPVAEGRMWYRTDRKVLYLATPAKLGMADYMTIDRIRPGRYFIGSITAAALTTFTLSANTLYAYPIIVPVEMPVDRIAINVTSAGASGTRARAGIYLDDRTQYPGSLYIDSGELAVDTTGVKEAVVSFTLAGGTLYWLALVSSGGPAVRAMALSSVPCIFDLDGTLGTAMGIGWSVSYSYAALPSTFPSGGTIWSPGAVPVVALRRA